MAEVSAGILAWRRGAVAPEVLLAHPGGPYWARRDAAAWSIPKGVLNPGEDAWAAACREFREELGGEVVGDGVPLAVQRTSSGKLIHAWLVEMDFDPAKLVSNRFEMEWPPRSGRTAQFPEVDRAAWFAEKDAQTRIHKGQSPILEEAFGRIRQAAAR